MPPTTAVASLLMTLAGEPLAGTPPPAPSHAERQERDGQADFDFIHGTWKVRNRRLKQPLTGSTEWYEFDATAVERPLWNGGANVEEYEGQSPLGPIQGMALRLYDAQARQWSIYWANRAKGTFEPPTVGAFKDGRGEFFSHETFQGRSIFVRFVWSDITPASARWEQSFSVDGGRTWEPNWVMEFSRVK